MFPTENVQRKIAVVLVIPVKETARLMPVDPIVSHVQIDDDSLRCVLVQLEKGVQEELLDLLAIGSCVWPVPVSAEDGSECSCQPAACLGPAVQTDSALSGRDCPPSPPAADRAGDDRDR